uniref:protein-tyrosine-phosphatase n=1 Tax=Trypanosoma congolense (strain IL3000) TaxID=1068625 RepID=G0ULZ7_TRYCI|nr:putative dual-specificity protein phosphatase [Trypanosoma congolense IL3000]
MFDNVMQSSNSFETKALPSAPLLAQGSAPGTHNRPIGRRHHHFTDDNVVDLRCVGGDVDRCVDAGFHRGGSPAGSSPTVPHCRPSHGVSPPTRILDFLFLGSVKDATNAEFLRRENIVTILNVSREEYWSVDSGITIHPFPVEDTAEEDIRKYFSYTYRLLEVARQAHYCFKLRNARVTNAIGMDATPCGSDSAEVGQRQRHDMGGAESNSSNASAHDGAGACVENPVAAGKPPCVLVHCRYGCSRSPTIVLAYLMRRNGWPLEDALQYIVCRRPVVEPNVGFLNTLLSFQSTMEPEKRKIQRELLSLVVRNLPPNTSSSVVHKFFEDRVGCVQKVASFSPQATLSSSSLSADVKNSESNDNGERTDTMWLVVFAAPDCVQLVHHMYRRNPSFFEPLGVKEQVQVKLTPLSKLHRMLRTVEGSYRPPCKQQAQGDVMEQMEKEASA